MYCSIFTYPPPSPELCDVQTFGTEQNKLKQNKTKQTLTEMHFHTSINCATCIPKSNQVVPYLLPLPLQLKWNLSSLSLDTSAVSLSWCGSHRIGPYRTVKIILYVHSFWVTTLPMLQAYFVVWLTFFSPLFLILLYRYLPYCKHYWRFSSFPSLPLLLQELSQRQRELTYLPFTPVLLPLHFYLRTPSQVRLLSYPSFISCISFFIRPSPIPLSS